MITTQRRRRLPCFRHLAETYAARAHNYRTIGACRLAIGRIRSLWTARGSYGCEADELREATDALKNRIYFLAHCSDREAAMTSEDRARQQEKTELVIELADRIRIRSKRYWAGTQDTW